MWHWGPGSLAALHTGAVDIRLLAPGAPQRAVAIGANVKMPRIMFARDRPADRAFPAVRQLSALRALQMLRLPHVHSCHLYFASWGRRPDWPTAQPPPSSTFPQGQDPSKCHEGPGHEDQRREVDQPQAPASLARSSAEFSWGRCSEGRCARSGFGRSSP